MVTKINRFHFIIHTHNGYPRCDKSGNFYVGKQKRIHMKTINYSVLSPLFFLFTRWWWSENHKRAELAATRLFVEMKWAYTRSGNSRRRQAQRGISEHDCAKWKKKEKELQRAKGKTVRCGEFGQSPVSVADFGKEPLPGRSVGRQKVSTVVKCMLWHQNV